MDWKENPGMYVARSYSEGILILGPLSIKESFALVQDFNNKGESRTIMYKSWNGQVPVLEVIMEILYRQYLDNLTNDDDKITRTE